MSETIETIKGTDAVLLLVQAGANVHGYQTRMALLEAGLPVIEGGTGAGRALCTERAALDAVLQRLRSAQEAVRPDDRSDVARGDLERALTDIEASVWDLGRRIDAQAKKLDRLLAMWEVQP